MLNKENLLISSKAGYIKAKLTIGARNGLSSKKRGYIRDDIGNLKPNQIGSNIIDYLYVNQSGTVLTNAPFYYKNIKYTNNSTAKTLFDDWNALIDQTVEIWLGEGGEGIKLILLQGLSVFLWRTA